MANATIKKNEKRIPELRGSERTFQYDRDTLIVYTGMHPGDMRPFIRIGAGDAPPGGLLRHIENVILPDVDPTNVSLEMFWLNNTLEQSGEIIQYVGSRDQITRLYSFTGMKERAESQDDLPVKLMPYKPLQARQATVSRDKCLINFYETGNLNVSVDGAKVLDLSAFKRSVLNLDKEYDLISKVLKKRKRRCEEGVSFLYLEGSRSPGLSMYWNFKGQGLLLNPPRDFHYRLFESVIDPGNVSMCAAATSAMPGYTEVLRRRNHLGREIGLFSLDAEKVAGDLKQIYGEARIKNFGDSSSLPSARDTTFFTAKGGGYGLFSTRLSSKSDVQTMIVFPTGGGKPGLTFDFFRGPYDLMFDIVNDVKSLKENRNPAYLFLHAPGQIKEKAYNSAPLTPSSFPLVGDREYKLFFGEKPASLFEEWNSLIANTPYENPIRNLMIFCLGLDFNPEHADKHLQEIMNTPVPAKEDLILRANLSEILRFIEDLPLVSEGFSPKQRKFLDRVKNRFGLRKVKVGDWRALREKDVEFRILFLNGKKAYQAVHVLDTEIVRFTVPPSLDSFEAEHKNYRTLLKGYTRKIDKADNAPGYPECTEFLETLLEERERLFHERRRFENLLQGLDISLKREEKSTIPDFIPKALHPAYKALQSFIGKIRDALRNLFRSR